MVAEGGGGINRSLQETPTWALATVCFVFIFLGLFIEQLIHLASHWLKKHRKVSMYEATEKLKSVLMQLGFMSLILTVTQRSISKICIPTKVANSMLPCRRQTETKTTKSLEHLWISLISQNSISQAKLEDVNLSHQGRALAAATSTFPDHCGSKVCENTSTLPISSSLLQRNCRGDRFHFRSLGISLEIFKDRILWKTMQEVMSLFVVTLLVL
ncbi:hypothetical protein CDL12_24271 [Handroanthus impetiginosus]|uniref:MLO-like protein n=1 Tax=Handroanthus impetiginosus TaxID=429701 RepID=A0A2G9GD38_9LAMI|nr:hypothetical protein CDL12_24271 [Handroanthus impetiginosus]